MADPTASGFHRLESELQREKRLTEASVALHTTLDLDEVLAMILSAACEGVGAERGTVFVRSRDGDEIWSRSLRGEEHVEIRLPMGRGIAGSVAESGEPIRIDDAYADPRFDRRWDEASGFRTRQVLCTPIRNRARETVGVFQLLNKREGVFDASDESYLDALSVHAALALENARLHLSALERERQEREILLVQDIQRAYMPERSGLELPGLEAAALNLLCEDASGDYYDFIALPDGRRAVVIGDVSGHGLRSALVMAQARAFLRAYCDTLDDLDDVISRLDVALARDLSGGLFMSLVVLVIDPESGALTWCNAGHPAVLHLGAGGVEPLSPTSRILGVFPESGPRCGTPRTLASGDVLLLYTDGATEAFDDRREMFGEERLRDVLEENAGAAPAELVAAVHAALCAWKGVDHMDDDLTLVAVRRL